MSFFNLIPPQARAQLVEFGLGAGAKLVTKLVQEWNRPDEPEGKAEWAIDEVVPARRIGSPYRHAMAPLAEAVLDVNNYLERNLEHAGHRKSCDCDGVLLRYEASVSANITRALAALTTTETVANPIGNGVIGQLNHLAVSPPASMTEQGRALSKVISQLRKLAELDEARRRSA